MRNGQLSRLQSEIAELEFRAEHLENFQNITNDLKDNFTSLNYIRRYSHVGPRSQRTKFYGTTNLSNSTVYRMKNFVESNSNDMYTITRTGSGDVAVYFKNRF
jgi:hypothetical protein